MRIEETEIPGVKVLYPARFSDNRGNFSETYNRKTLADAGLNTEFVQDNHSLSRTPGTVRGLHFQIPPFDQAKLVRVVRGKVFDVAVDIRRNSPTFGKYVSCELSAEEWNQLFIPSGFAHGFCTYEPDTEVIYKVTNFYSPQSERGICWNDPDLSIDWPLDGREPLLSDKDRVYPSLKTIEFELNF